mmetsp:Transcript_9002/g.20454  ORF Transcript_9002/g.20454 Transcript_9002/m.20454 type:complete len:302 (-) Transcript_9002:336-1241(-)
MYVYATSEVSCLVLMSGWSTIPQNSDSMSRLLRLIFRYLWHSRRVVHRTRSSSIAVAVRDVATRGTHGDTRHLATHVNLTTETLSRDVCRLLTRNEHRAERRAHARGASHLRNLHPANDEAVHDLGRRANDGILRGVHVQRSHARHILDETEVAKTFHATCSERTVVARACHHHLRLKHLGIHATLRLVAVKRDGGPVCHHASNTRLSAFLLADDEIFDGCCVEQFHAIAERLGDERARHHGSVRNDDVVALIFVLHSNLVEEVVSWLAHDHSAHELTTEPRTASGRDVLLDHGNLEVWKL